MSKKKIHFMGLLANVDSSILKVKLDHGFKIENMSCDEGVELIHPLTKCDRSLISIWLHPCIEITPDQLHDQLYFISNSFENTHKSQSKVINYLIPTIRSLRLFKEGNICVPFKYYFRMNNKTPKRSIFGTTLEYIGRGLKYSLKDSDIPNLQKFIQNTNLPFKESFLQLAFENFELSYTTRNKALSFLSLMISLEILFNPGKGALKKHNISKNTAVLLGKEEKDSEKIQYKIKELYNKRSDIVHDGKADITEKDLLNLRFYVRESIKEIYKIDKNKDELLDILNSCSFGERPWRNE